MHLLKLKTSEFKFSNFDFIFSPPKLSLSEKNLQFEQIMLNKQNKYLASQQNKFSNIDIDKLKSAHQMVDKAKNYKTWSLARKKLLDKASDLCIEAYGLDLKKTNKEWFILGTFIWGLGGLKNINITGFSSLIISIIKQSINIAMPFYGSYLDIALTTAMSNLSKNGFPIFDESIKKAPSYKIIKQDYKSLLHNIKHQINTNNITQKSLQDFSSRLETIKQNNRKQNDNLQYALIGSWRSIVRIAITTLLVSLLVGTGGISLPINLAIISLGQILYMLACGIDNKNQNKHIIKCLLKRNCFINADNELNIQKVVKLYLNKAEIEKQQIKTIYTYHIAELQKQIDICNGDSNSTNYLENQRNIIKKRNILEYSKNKLLEQIDIYEHQNWQNLNPQGLIAQCLSNKKFKIKQAIKAECSSTNAVEGQIIKNYASNIPALVLSVSADGVRYEVDESANNSKEIAFSILKPSAGISSAIQRPFCSTAREVNKKNLTHKNDLNKKQDKYNYPVTLKIHTPQGIELDLFAFSSQSKRIISLKKRFKRCLKGIYQSTIYIATLPYEISSTKYLYRKTKKQLKESKKLFKNAVA